IRFRRDRRRNERVLLLDDADDLARRPLVDVETGVEPVLRHGGEDIIASAMPTFFQKIKLAIRGFNRRREEANQAFVAKNAWCGGQTILSVPEGQAGLPVLHIDMEGLVCAFLDDSGRIAYYLDTETGDVVDI